MIYYIYIGLREFLQEIPICHGFSPWFPIRICPQKPLKALVGRRQHQDCGGSQQGPEQGPIGVDIFPLNSGY